MILSPSFQEALDYASIVHGGHVRKGTEIPYISHLLAVTSIVLEYGSDEDEAIAALLHDAVEDAGGQSRLGTSGYVSVTALPKLSMDAPIPT